MPMTQDEMVKLLKANGWKKTKAEKAHTLKWTNLVSDQSLFRTVNSISTLNVESKRTLGFYSQHLD